MLHFRNTGLASIAFDSLDLVGRIIKPVWLNTLSLAAELHGAENICSAIGRRIVNEGSLKTVSSTRSQYIKTHEIFSSHQLAD